MADLLADFVDVEGVADEVAVDSDATVEADDDVAEDLDDFCES